MISLKPKTKRNPDYQDPPASTLRPDTPDQGLNLYQAIGWIHGRLEKSEAASLVLRLDDGNTVPVTASGKLLNQLCKRWVTDKPGIDKLVWLKCYPQFDIKTGQLYFQVFWYGVKPLEEGAVSGLFILRGIWQLIPQQKRPVFSIYRNQKRDYSDYLKTSHLPLIWHDEKPYSFKKNSEERPHFYQIEARLLPTLGCFGWVRNLAAPSNPPKKVKATPPPNTANQSSKKKIPTEHKTQ